MEKRKLLKSFFMMLFLATVFIFATAQTAVSEMAASASTIKLGHCYVHAVRSG
jgi:hypothetical protein